MKAGRFSSLATHTRYITIISFPFIYCQAYYDNQTLSKYKIGNMKVALCVDGGKQTNLFQLNLMLTSIMYNMIAST